MAKVLIPVKPVKKQKNRVVGLRSDIDKFITYLIICGAVGVLLTVAIHLYNFIGVK